MFRLNSDLIHFFSYTSIFILIITAFSSKTFEQSFPGSLSLNEIPDTITFNMMGQIQNVAVKKLFAGKNAPGFRYFISSRVMRDALTNTEAHNRGIPVAIPIRPNQFMRFVAFCIALIDNNSKKAFEKSFDPKKGLGILKDLAFDPELLSDIESLVLAQSDPNALRNEGLNVYALSDSEDMMVDDQPQTNPQIRLLFGNGDTFLLADNILNELRSIKPSLIANSLTDNDQSSDILTIKLPAYLRNVTYPQVQNLFAAVSALYAHNRVPSNTELLIALRIYLENINAVSIAEVSDQLQKLRILALFFEYKEFAASISYWLNVLKSYKDPISILTRLHEKERYSSTKIMRKLISPAVLGANPHSLTLASMRELIERYRAISYLLGYNLIEKTLSQVNKSLAIIERWATILQKNKLTQNDFDVIEMLKDEFIVSTEFLAKAGNITTTYNRAVEVFSAIFNGMLTANNYAFAINFLEDMKKSY